MTQTTDPSWPSTLDSIRSVLMDVRIETEDCGSIDGIEIGDDANEPYWFPRREEFLAGRVLSPRASRLAGIPHTGTVRLDVADRVLRAADRSRTTLRIRSPISCEATSGVCAHCWGGDVATGQVDAVGSEIGRRAVEEFSTPQRAKFRRRPGFTLMERNTPIATESSGVVRYAQLPNGCELAAGRFYGGRDSEPCLVFLDREGTGIEFAVDIVGSSERLLLPHEARIVVQDGATVEPGQVLAWRPSCCLRPFRTSEADWRHVAAWLEAKAPGPIAHLVVRDDEVVRSADDPDGIFLDPSEVLEYLGEERCASIILREVQDDLRSRRVVVDSRCIELVLRFMLRWVEVTDPGDTSLSLGEILDSRLFFEANEAVLSSGGIPARGSPAILGISEVRQRLGR